MPEKLATCCYCGKRTALRVMEHKLACGSCGAPLRNMKPLLIKQARAAASHAATPQPHKMPKASPKRSKKRKSVWKRLADRLEDVFEEIEDIFD